MYLGQLSSTAMRESPLDAKRHLPYKKFLDQKHIDELLQTGIVVIDDALTSDELAQARHEVNKLLDFNTLFAINENDDLDVRQDMVQWIGEKACSDQQVIIGSGLLHALRCIRAIPHELVVAGFDQKRLGVPFSNQLACYDGNGSHYVPHRDKPEQVNAHPLGWLVRPGMDDREITIILYLNEKEWISDADGRSNDGNLRCYMNAHSDDTSGKFYS